MNMSWTEITSDEIRKAKEIAPRVGRYIEQDSPILARIMKENALRETGIQYESVTDRLLDIINEEGGKVQR